MNIKNIGTKPISEQEKKWRRYYRELMTEIGYLPNHWTNQHEYAFNSKKCLDKDHFSTNYKTREEFEDDRCKILAYLNRMEYAPEDLVNKVVETVKELDLQYGE